MSRKLVSSGSPFEQSVGFSRAVRVGSWIAVAGTAPIAQDGSVAHPGDAYGQTKRCLEIILRAIAEAGGTAEQVIRTRVMLTNIADWSEAARAHGEVFGAIRPACTVVQVTALIEKGWLVEIEADAVVE
jgi:enamine deaminase RidA (YjgF/YER057c/UK114 family)